MNTEMERNIRELFKKISGQKNTIWRKLRCEEQFYTYKN